MDGKRHIVVIDNDGTLFPDSMDIIYKVMQQNAIGNNIVIGLLYSLIVTVYRLGILSNSKYTILFAIWMIARTLKCTTSSIESAIIEQFKVQYIKCLPKIEKVLQDIDKQISHPVIITNNPYAILAVRTLLIDYEVIYAESFMQRLEHVKSLQRYHTIDYMVGDNMLDDILIAYLVKTKSIYIGTGWIKLFATKQYRTIQEIVK